MSGLIPLETARKKLARRSLLNTAVLLPSLLQSVTIDGWTLNNLLSLLVLAGLFLIGALRSPFWLLRLCLLTACAFYVLVLGFPFWGLSSGPIAVTVLGAVYSTLLIGRTAGFVATALGTAAIIAAGYGHVHGLLPIHPSEAGLPTPAGWIRSGVLLLGLLTFPLPPILGFLNELQRAVESQADALNRTIAEEMDRDAALRAQRVTQEELRGAQRELTLGRIAGGLAHEINTVLQEIEGWLEALRSEESQDAARQEAIREMRESARRAAAVGRRLLYVGGQNLSSTRPVDLRRYLERVRLTLGAALGTKNELLYKVETCPIVLADPSELTHALVNLVVNARDALRGPGHVTVQARAATPLDLKVCPRVAAVICVSDDGPGIPSDVLEHVFEPFFTTKGKNGTGLGLATVRKLVEGTGGKVLIQSARGEGTTVSLLLPGLEVEEELQTEGAPGSAPRNTSFELETPLSVEPVVLFVEDQESIRQVFMRVVPKGGVRLIEADCVDRALQILETQRPDLIWSDAIMPGRPTQDLIERAKTTGIPIVICSGHVQEDLLRRDIRASEVEFVPKPYSARQLIARARAAAADRRLQDRLKDGATSAAVPSGGGVCSEPPAPAVSFGVRPNRVLVHPLQRLDHPALTLRSIPAQASNAQTGQVSTQGDAGSGPGPAPCRILLADDDQSVRKSLRRGLERLGFTVVEAVDGLDAETIFLEKRPFDVIVLDANMPGRSGPDTAHVLKQIAPETRIVLCTGYGADAYPPDGIEAILPKPIALMDLADRLREISGRPVPPVAS